MKRVRAHNKKIKGKVVVNQRVELEERVWSCVKYVVVRELGVLFKDEVAREDGVMLNMWL